MPFRGKWVPAWIVAVSAAADEPCKGLKPNSYPKNLPYVVEDADCKAWQKMFDDMGGTSWAECSQLRNDPCNCYNINKYPHTANVQCQQTGAKDPTTGAAINIISGLDLTVGMSGHFSEGILGFENLVVLQITGNDGLTGTIPDLSSLAKVTSVELHQNSFVGAVPDVGPKVTYVSLYGNKLTHIPKSFCPIAAKLPPPQTSPYKTAGGCVILTNWQERNNFLCCPSCKSDLQKCGVENEAWPGHCEVCPNGDFFDNTGDLTCHPCPAGRYSAPDAKLNITTCSPMLSICQVCPAGKFSSAGRPSCSKCVVGKYSPSDAQVSCDSCAAGKFGRQISPDSYKNHSSEKAECASCPGS
jgi:hypothetical protein